MVASGVTVGLLDFCLASIANCTSKTALKHDDAMAYSMGSLHQFNVLTLFVTTASVNLAAYSCFGH